MNALVLVLAISTVAALLLAGYLFGARAGRAVRGALSDAKRTAETRVVELEAELAARPKGSELVKAELEGMLAPLLANKPKDQEADLLREVQGLTSTIATREQSNDSFRSEVRGLLSTLVQHSPNPDQVSKELQRAMAPLLAQRTEGTSDVRKMMSEMLAPMLDRERLGHELSTLRVGSAGLAELPRLLDAIAEKAGFATVVLSDEAGLPLAASAAAGNVEGLSGAAAFFLTLADRAERSELPRPVSCVVLDETNRMTLHRMFAVGTARFTLSAVARGQNLAPGALDAALSPLERVLTRQELS